MNVNILKYVAAVTILTAIVMHTIPGTYPYNMLIHCIGACIWTYVGLKWKEYSILLNFSPQVVILLSGLVVYYMGLTN